MLSVSNNAMKDEQFYAQLFRPVHECIGQMDETDIIPFVGFDRSGLIRLSTVGRDQEEFVTYVTCELATRREQRLAKFGNYEFMISCDDQPWARELLTQVGKMSFNTVFEDGDALEIRETLGPDFPLEGVIVEEFARASVDGRPCGIYRIHGVTRAELDYVIRFGANKLLEEFRNAGIYPHTSVKRKQSVVDEPQSLLPAPTDGMPLSSRRIQASSSS